MHTLLRLAFCVVSEDLNSSPQAYRTGTLWTEPSPQPQGCFCEVERAYWEPCEKRHREPSNLLCSYILWSLACLWGEGPLVIFSLVCQARNTLSVPFNTKSSCSVPSTEKGLQKVVDAAEKWEIPDPLICDNEQERNACFSIWSCS